MKPIEGKKALAVALAMTMLSCSVAAQVANLHYSEFLKSISDTIGKSFTESINNLVFTFMVDNKVSELAGSAEKDIPDYMIKDPPLKDAYVKGVIDMFVSILEPFYAAAVTAVGLYIIFSSQSPRGRATAKSLLLSLMLGIILTPLTIDIVTLILDASRYLSSEILALSNHPGDYALMLRPAVDYFQSYMARLMVINVAASIPFMIIALFFALGVFAVLVVRYIFVMLLAMLFPLAVFMLFFYYTRRIGEFLFKQLFFWAFIPAAYAAAFVVVGLSKSAVVSISPGFANFVDIAGAFFIIISPLILFFLMNWLSAVMVPVSLIITPLWSPAQTQTGGSSSSKAAAKRKSGAGASAPRAALGLRGLQRAAEEEGETQESADETRGGQKSQTEGGKQKGAQDAMTRPTASFNAGGGNYNRDLQSAGERISVPGARKAMIPPSTSGMGRPETKKGMLVVSIPSRATPSIALEIPKGEIDTVNVLVRNETDEPIYKIRVFDEDLTGAGIQISYSQGTFSLKAQEERTFSISFSPLEESGAGVHNGGIAFQTDRGSTSSIEVAIRVLSKDDVSHAKKESKSALFGRDAKEETGAAPGSSGPSLGRMSRYSASSEMSSSGTVPSGATGAAEMERKQRAQSAEPSGAPSGAVAAGAQQPEKKMQAPPSSESEAAGVSGNGKTAGRRAIDLDHADDYDAAKAAQGTTQDATTGLKTPRRFVEKAVIEATRLTTVDSDSLKVTRPIMSLPRLHLKALFLGYRKKK